MKKSLTLRRAFSLVEIMIVVVVIGIIAAISSFAWQYHIRKVRAAQLVQGYRVISQAAQVYVSENGQWPADNANGLPPELASAISAQGRGKQPVAGGYWAWRNIPGQYAPDTTDPYVCVTYVTPQFEDDLFLMVDAKMDDGLLRQGKFQGDRIPGGKGKKGYSLFVK